MDARGTIFEYDADLYMGLALLFLGGFASGFLGIGGGFIVVPILAVVMGLPMHIAVATSMLTMIFTSISGASTHIMLGNVIIAYAIPLVLGIVLVTTRAPSRKKTEIIVTREGLRRISDSNRNSANSVSALADRRWYNGGEPPDC